MSKSLLIVFACLLVCVTATQQTSAQQQAAAPAPTQPQVQIPAQAAPQGAAPAQPPGPPPAPPGFQLNAPEQAYLDIVLKKWEDESGKISIFSCNFELWEYDATFGPGANIPLNKNKGELSYQKPDKGSFEITEVNTWKANPVPANGPPAQPNGDWVKQDVVGQHWVCDGQDVYEYRTEQKQLVVHPIPQALQGKAIVDGPLPFLFGAEAAKLKQRYWLKVEQQPNQNEIWIQSRPKFQADAANYQAVRLILDRQQMMPKAMQVYMPNGDQHVYMFDIAHASVNSTLAKIQSLFSAPRTPYGWKKVVEEAPVQQQVPVAPAGTQAAQPGAAAR